MRFADLPVGAYFRFPNASPTCTPYRKIPEYVRGQHTFNAELPRLAKSAHKTPGHWSINPDDEVQVVDAPT